LWAGAASRHALAMRMKSGFACLAATSVLASGCGGASAGDAGTDGIDASEAIDAATDVGPIEVEVESIEMTRWVDAGTALATASVTVRYATPFPVDRVVNVGVDVNGDGRIASYALASGAMQEEWIVEDETWPIAGGGLTHWFALLDPAASRSELRARTIVSTAPLGAAPTLGESAPSSLERVVMLEEIESPTLTTVIGDAFGGGMGKQPPQEHFDAFAEGVVVGSTRTASGVRRTGMPDPIQGRNGCLLSSLASGLSWLSRGKGFAECLPGVESSELSILEGEINRVGELGWTEDVGVLTSNIAPGITRFLERTGVPITLRTIEHDDADARGSAMRIGQALVDSVTHDCAVVIGVQFPEGKHALTLSGLSLAASGAVTGLVVHNSQTETYDDAHAISRAGTGELQLRHVPRSDLQGRDRGPGTVAIRSLHILCVGGVPSVRLAFAHNAIAMGSDVHRRCFDEGHDSTPDMCACDHFHSGPRGTSIRGEPRVMEMAENPCGHGCYSASTPWSDLEVRCCGIPPPP